MYTGHIGIALAVKGARSELSLWLLCFAALMPDLVDFSAQPFGADTSGLTHTLPGMLGEGVLFFLLGWAIVRNLGAALAAGLTACSHMPADLLTSRLVLWPGGPVAGLHWYRYHLLDLAVEATVVAVGWLLYGRTLPGPRRFSVASLAMLVLLLSLQGMLATMDVA
jgi:hypothetical protein